MGKINPEWIQQKGKDCTLGIFVQAGAKNNEIVGEHGPWLKIKVEGQRVEGKANESLVEFLSEYFKVKKNDISILRGELSKYKIIMIRDRSVENILSQIHKNFVSEEKARKK